MRQYHEKIVPEFQFCTGKTRWWRTTPTEPSTECQRSSLTPSSMLLHRLTFSFKLDRVFEHGCLSGLGRPTHTTREPPAQVLSSFLSSTSLNEAHSKCLISATTTLVRTPTCPTEWLHRIRHREPSMIGEKFFF